MIQQTLNALVLLGLLSSPLVEAAPATTTTVSSQADSQPKSNLICGKTGWNGSQDSFLSTGYCNSWAYCQGVCELHSGCQSFAYFNGATGDTGGDCELYSVPVQGNFVSDSSSPYKFYDKSCMTAEKKCNVKGYSRIDSFTGVNANSIGDCATICSGYNEYSTGCVSYAFGQGSCQLYSYLVIDNVDVDSTSPFVFNDALCGQSTSTMTTTTTTTKNTGKTTTTTKITTTKTSSTTTTTTKAVSPKTTTTSTVKTTTTTTTKSSSAIKSTTTTKTSSKSITTTKTTSTVVASNSPQCGVAGWFRTDPIFDFSVDSLSSCGDFCYDFSGGATNCVAYAYSSQTGDCRLYNSSVADSVWVTSTSEFNNYDLACYTSTTTTTTTNKAGGKTTTTTAIIPTTTTTTKKSSQITTTTTTTKKTSKTTATTTTTTGATTSSPAAQCGVVGWGRADPFFDYIGDTLQECAQDCFNNRGAPNYCLSYSYGYTGHECKLYSNVTVADNVYVNSDSDFGNYDLPCYNASLNIDPSKCTPGYNGAQCNYKFNYDNQNNDASYILNSFDDCVILCNSFTNCRYVVWYRQAAEGVAQNTCQLLTDPFEGGVALNGVDSADRFY